MSKTGLINIYFKASTVIDHFNDLLKDWSYNDHGHITYFLDEDYTWLSAPLHEWAMIRLALEKNIRTRKSAA